MRWPLPTGMMVSMARMPVAIGLVDMFAVERTARRLRYKGDNAAPAGSGFAVERLAETVEHAVEQIGADGDLGIVLAGDHTVVQLDAVDLFERHGEHMAIAESDYLNAHAATAGSDHFAEIAHSGRRPARCHQHADQFHYFAGPWQGSGVAHLLDVRNSGRTLTGPKERSLAIVQLVGETALRFRLIACRPKRRVRRD
jgi:hypothetical protein